MAGQGKNQSEVAALREKIRLECEAMELLASGLSKGADHRAIHMRYENLERHTLKIADLIGTEAATLIAGEVYNLVLSGPSTVEERQAQS